MYDLTSSYFEGVTCPLALERVGAKRLEVGSPVRSEERDWERILGNGVA